MIPVGHDCFLLHTHPLAHCCAHIEAAVDSSSLWWLIQTTILERESTKLSTPSSLSFSLFWVLLSNYPSHHSFHYHITITKRIGITLTFEKTSFETIIEGKFGHHLCDGYLCDWVNFGMRRETSTIQPRRTFHLFSATKNHVSLLHSKSNYS